MVKYIYLFFFLSAPLHAEVMDTILKSTVTVDAVVVGSSCSVVIDNGVSRSGVVDFGVYNTTMRSGILEKLFQIKLYEQGSLEPGCSAFLAGTGLVTFSFGDRNAGQLDKNGVVMRGVGGGVRIAISSTDVGEVSSIKTITSSMPNLTYSRDFASRGVFGFKARALGLESASAGVYSGSLSVVVSYQ